jgi:putative spermidine/putrescine transport system ATP-binding protein
LFPHLTVFENVAFPLQMRRRSRQEIESRVADVLSIVELSHVAQRFPRELSGGQQQRVALARATVYQPPLVLMDEPLGALDRRLREQMQYEIKRLHKALGSTLVYVTHDQEEAMSMSDRVCLMNSGRIEQLGTPEALYFRPETLFAANFLGESNFFRGRVVALNGNGAKIALPSGDTVLIPRPREISEQQRDIQFMLRPENISVLPPGETSVNALKGMVIDISFSGSSYKMFVKLESGDQLVARVSSNNLLRGCQAGDSVLLSWRIDDAVVFA